jgi:hypothetical protein
VKEGYHALRVVTVDDRVHLGVKVREADGLLVLRTPEDKEAAVPVKDIAERAEAKSIMPEGLTDTLTKQEFGDLVAFLSALGKVGGPYAPSKARVVRRWQVIDPTSRRSAQVQLNVEVRRFFSDSFVVDADVDVLHQVRRRHRDQGTELRSYRKPDAGEVGARLRDGEIGEVVDPHDAGKRDRDGSPEREERGRPRHESAGLDELRGGAVRRDR